MSYKREKVLINGHEWSYINMGKGEPVVLLHGIMNYADYLVPLAETLKHEFNIIIPDIPGFGFTKPLKQGNTYKNIAKELPDFFKKLSLKEIRLFGFSMGGIIALETSLTNEKTIRELLLLSTPWRKSDVYMSPLTEFLVHGILYHIDPNLTGKVRDEAIENYSNLIAKQDPNIEILFKKYGPILKESLLHTDVKGAIEVFKSIEDTDITSRLKPLNIRTLVIACETDGFLDPMEELSLVQRLGTDNYELVKDEGHNFILTAPDKLGMLVKEKVITRF